jgi:NAD(P)-dependent dehydrogenase (short-subunit alcohol dehydrogenase family)
VCDSLETPGCIFVHHLHSHEKFLAQFNTNVFGPVNVTQALLPHFRQKRSGFVVMIGSIAGWQGQLNAGPYCGSKFALADTLRPSFDFCPPASDTNLCPLCIYECLKEEMALFGIKSIIFDLGYYRTKVMAPDNILTAPANR